MLQVQCQVYEGMLKISWPGHSKISISITNHQDMYFVFVRAIYISKKRNV